MDEIARRFRDAIEPLRVSGKLGVVLLQYPVWVPISRAGRRAIEDARARLAGMRVAVEFRNRTWMSEDNRAETLAFLRDADCAYTCVDEPQGFASSVPPVAAVTSEIAVVRFHGRNRRRWNERTETAAARMDYLYTRGELEEWVPRIQGLAAEAAEVHVVMNNCHRDYAVRNAAEMRALVEEARVAPSDSSWT